MRRHLPNAITAGNLLFGMWGIFLALTYDDLYAAAWCMGVASVLDVADGAVARALRVHSPIGKDLDSLADMVTFGVLPSFMLIVGLRLQGYLFEWWTILPACVAVAAAFRLAKFNQDASQSTVFKGLPSPAAALTLLGPAVQAANTAPFEPHWVIAPPALLAWAGLVSVLMVSNIRLFSFKQPIRATLPYICAIVVVGLGSLPLLQGGCTLAATGAYVLASQVYFRYHPNQA